MSTSAVSSSSACLPTLPATSEPDLSEELRELSERLQKDPSDPDLQCEFVETAQRACKAGRWDILTNYKVDLRNHRNRDRKTLLDWAIEQYKKGTDNSVQILENVRALFGLPPVEADDNKETEPSTSPEPRFSIPIKKKPQGCSDFAGFASGGQIVDILTKAHNTALKTFAMQLFEQVSKANAQGRQEKIVTKDRMFLDAVAQILTGNEVCAAIALSGHDILIATNQGTQDRRYVSWDTRGMVLEKQEIIGGAKLLRLGFKCCLESPTGQKQEKSAGVALYRLINGQPKAELMTSEPIEFRLSEGEFPYLPDDDIAVKMKLIGKLDADYFQFLFQYNIGANLKVWPPLVTCRGALGRRTAKLFNHLSSISNAILRRNIWLPERVKKNVRHYAVYIEENYGRYKKTHPQGNADGFIESIRQGCVSKLNLDKGGYTSETFLKVAREHFRGLALKDRVFADLEQHEGWILILNDSLTYELSRSDDFKDHINVSSKPPQGVHEMGNLYGGLIQDYINYKKSQNIKRSSVAAVMKWLDTLDMTQLPCPAFIADKMERFRLLARRYFIQLAVIEQYVEEDAERDGALAQRLAKEHPFKAPEVILVDGEEGIHAEMRLFNYHLMKNAPSDYYGIAKLCCALCNYTLKQFGIQGFHPPSTRGAHATLFTWPLPELLLNSSHMQHFLGPSLFEKYSAFTEPRRLETLNKGPIYDLQEVCRALISRLDGMNSGKNLKRLGIDTGLLIQGSQDHYPDNYMPQSLPSDHPSAPFEQQLESLKKEHGDVSHVDFWIPLFKLGVTWKQEKNLQDAAYYLEQAARLADQFPDQIDKEEIGDVFNVLGNVYRGLKLYERALECFTQALKIRKQIYQAPHSKIGGTLNNLAMFHTEQGEFAQASIYFEQALYEASGDHALTDLIQKNLSQLQAMISKTTS